MGASGGVGAGAIGLVDVHTDWGLATSLVACEKVVPNMSTHGRQANFC